MDNGHSFFAGAAVTHATSNFKAVATDISPPQHLLRVAKSARSSTFRIGKVRGDLRSRVWYLTYHEHGVRQRPRVGPDLGVARQLAAQINGQLASSAPAALSFRPISIEELRSHWLDYHEHVARSSIQTVRRYRAATEHLERFLKQERVPRSTAQFRVEHAERFVKYLRSIQVHPNGHALSAVRPLLDKGIKFILEACRAMFGYAIKHRHLSPYADNPFKALELDRLPVEDSKPIVLFTDQEESRFLSVCDEWQLPIFATLLLTGIRPGELCHLLLPHDMDWDAALLRIRNKPRLGWQVKTRDERDIPMIPALMSLLRKHVGNRVAGPVFLQRRYGDGLPPKIGFVDELQLQRLAEQTLASRRNALKVGERALVGGFVGGLLTLHTSISRAETDSTPFLPTAVADRLAFRAGGRAHDCRCGHAASPTLGPVIGIHARLPLGLKRLLFGDSRESGPFP